jgi:hypothetical protein
LFDAESAAAQREELNLLYVAIARQVFIASGIENTRDQVGHTLSPARSGARQFGRGFGPWRRFADAQ